MLHDSWCARLLWGLAGVLIGALLWGVYLLTPLPLESIPALLGILKTFSGWLDFVPDGRFLLWLLMLAKALPGSVVLGVAVGILLPRLGARRWLCGTILCWPLLLYVWTLLALLVFQRHGGAALTQPLWQQRNDWLLAGLTLYAVFFLTLFLAYRAASPWSPGRSGHGIAADS